MAYLLTLTRDERKAIDHVGHRYGHGNELYDALCECEWNCDWDSPDVLILDVPEFVAWTINEIAEDCSHNWDLFCDKLAKKLDTFCDQIV